MIFLAKETKLQPFISGSMGRLSYSFLILFCGTFIYGWDIPQRRHDQFVSEFSYYVYPIVQDIPGLGQATGVGGSVLNIGDQYADFTGFKLDGDFSASGYVLLDLHAIERRLIFDAGYYDFNVFSTQYSRGIDSDSNNYTLPHAKGAYALAQMTLTFEQRRYEAYIRILDGKSQLLGVSDSNGNPYEAIDTSEYKVRQFTIGGSIDLTDDRLDPRRGVRAELAVKLPSGNDSLMSKYFTSDLSITGYIPMRQGRDTLVLNYFQSDAYVSKKGETDYAVLKEKRGLGCDTLPLGEQEQCLQSEKHYLDELLASNLYGTATSLGGTQRLRSYDNYRFYAAHALAYGAEYRWNLTNEYTPFDIYFAKGIRTGIQIAFFAERGSVVENFSELWRKQQNSYGSGFRLILSGVVLRADWATGDEGNKFQAFITYPWSMFSVDHP